MKKQVLIVADDLKLSQSIQTQMDSNTMTTSSVASISEALCCVMKQEYDLVILDLQLPGIDELEMVRIIRIAKSIPVLALTEPLEDAEKIALFQAGMGTFMEKPIDAGVCAAQGDALIRLYRKPESDTRQYTALEIGPSAIINQDYRQVLVDGSPLELTRKEFDLLYFLVEHPYQVFSKEQLYEQVWKLNAEFGGDVNVKTHIKTLRKKLLPIGEGVIETVRGIGYRYVPPGSLQESAM